VGFYLIRHGETQWRLAAERRLKGWGNDLVPLTPDGVRQIEQVAETLRPLGVQLVLASPMTRALQSAAIIGRALDLRLVVELDLHEWVPDLSFTWDSAALVEAAISELTQLGGEWPAGERRAWEPLSRVRQRMLGVLQRYAEIERVAVVGHSVAISSLTGRPPELGEISEYDL
jgi:broad specificity phosphatase PhoE